MLEDFSENLFLCFVVISMSVSFTSSRTLEFCVFHFRQSHSTLSTISKHLTINSNTEKAYRDIQNEIFSKFIEIKMAFINDDSRRSLKNLWNFLLSSTSTGLIAIRDTRQLSVRYPVSSQTFVSKPLVTDDTVSMILPPSLGISVGCGGIVTVLLS